MLAISRCLMGAPELVMFDEPSPGLAPDGRAKEACLHQRCAILNREGPDLRAGRAERGGLAAAREPRLRAGKPGRVTLVRLSARQLLLMTAFVGLSWVIAGLFPNGGPMVTESLPTPSTSHSILSPATERGRRPPAFRS